MQSKLSDNNYVALLAARAHCEKAVGLLFSIEKSNSQSLPITEMTFQNRKLLSMVILDKQLGIDSLLESNLHARN